MRNGENLVIQKLNNLSIPFEIVQHPAVFTTEEADEYIEGKKGARTKSLFLTNAKKTNFYLLVMDDQKRLAMEKFAELVETKRIKFASSQALFEELQLTAGVVSPFGLLNNPKNKVALFFDRSVLQEEQICFHPNDNTKTLFLATEDLLYFLKTEKIAYQIVDL